jgi:hypothetical protein
MAKNDEQGALYLEKDGRIELVHGDDVADRKADGWKEPEGRRANGASYNDPKQQGARDAAADFAKKQAAEDQKEAEADAKAKASETKAKK